MPVTVTLLLVGPAPVSAGGPVAGSLVAPYAGAAWQTLNATFAKGCGFAHEEKYANWNATSGKGGFSVEAYAYSMGSPACGGSVAGVRATSSAHASGEIEVGIPVTVAANGVYHFKIGWGTHVSQSQVSVVPGKCAKSSAHSYSCQARAEAYLYGRSYLVDTTNRTTVPTASSAVCWQTACQVSSAAWNALLVVYNDTACSHGVCTTTAATTVYHFPGNHLTFFLNTSYPLLARHSYAVVTLIFGEASASVGAFHTNFTGAQAYANVVAKTLMYSLPAASLSLLYVNWK